ncbi:MAG: FAD-dependent hydroxylase [Thermosynechococcaceae cyanobacterium MS004]|nr:FAD-dependent hydroxylase [Thermosynechococcaceae cyanobacterium MS004]
MVQPPLVSQLNSTSVPEDFKTEALNLQDSNQNAILQNTILNYDLVIVGGGIVGATLAVALEGSGLTVLIVEAQKKAEAIAKGQAYAIHLSSSRIWDALGVWAAIEPQVQEFKQVHLSDGTDHHVVQFMPQDLGQDLGLSSLGHVAEHRVLLSALLDRVQRCKNIHWCCPARVAQTKVQGDYTELTVESLDAEAISDNPPFTVRSRLVIGADGAKSQVREQVGIKTRGKAYWQSCLVATIQPEKAHRNIAYERFWPSGPFAILPVSETHCRIVWTAPHAEAQRLQALNEQDFSVALTERYGTQMGQLTLVGDRFTFPAKLVHSCEYVRPRVALVGDAAHSCHPVGGQGLNLGVRDAAALAQILRTAQIQGEDIGSLAVLKRYQRWRRTQNILALSFTDILNRMFSNQILPLVVVRRLGLRLMSMIPWIKVTSLRFMAGLLGKAPLLLPPTPSK